MTSSIAERLGLNKEVRELRLGRSFSGKGAATFHSVRYDFKPASVDNSKRRTVDIGAGNQVTVTVPHIEGSAQTVFKGSKKPYQKECVLIIDHTTGEICLERLTYNIQLKKTRPEGGSKMQSRPITPIDGANLKKPSPTQKYSPTEKSSHSPVKEKPTLWPSTSHHYSPNQRVSPHLKPSPNNNNSPASQPSPSMPCLLGPSNGSSHHVPSLVNPPVQRIERLDVPEVGVLSDSSSDSGDSSSGNSSESESESENVVPAPLQKPVRGLVNGSSKNSVPLPSMPNFSLSEDLQLSESGSDSD